MNSPIKRFSSISKNISCTRQQFPPIIGLSVLQMNNNSNFGHFNFVGDNPTEFPGVRPNQKIIKEILMKENKTQLFQKLEKEDIPREKIQYVINEGEQYSKEFADLFPDKTLSKFRVVLIYLKTENDMRYWTSEVIQERNNLCEEFYNLAGNIVSSLSSSGYWVDAIDPSSGKPWFGSSTNASILETDERYHHFGVRTEWLGCCSVVTHPTWGSNVFMGSLFTDTPINQLNTVLEKIQSKQ